MLTKTSFSFYLKIKNEISLIDKAMYLYACTDRIIDYIINRKAHNAFTLFDCCLFNCDQC